MIIVHFSIVNDKSYVIRTHSHSFILFTHRYNYPYHAITKAHDTWSPIKHM